jgi:hypothetical protein
VYTPEERKAAQIVSKRKWRKAHPEKDKEAQRKRRQANPEKFRAQDRNYRESHIDQDREKQRKYRKAHPEKIREDKRKWTAKNPEKACEYSRKRKFGVTPENYKRMLLNQNGVCIICGGNRSKKDLCIDHDHTTNKIRGLLCSLCNSAFGLMEENIEWLQKMIDYKMQHLL